MLTFSNTLASQPINTLALKSNIFVFMSRLPAFLTASIVNSHLRQYNLIVIFGHSSVREI